MCPWALRLELPALPMEPYRVRHFRSGREGVAIEVNASGEWLHIFFPDRDTYEWRWASAFVRQEPMKSQSGPSAVAKKRPRTD